MSNKIDSEDGVCCRHSEADRELELRDYFAAKAMAALVSGHMAHYGYEFAQPQAGVAADAYEMADAMLQARSA